MKDKFYYGGQAVLEGIMMRGRTHYTIAVRQETKEISTVTHRLSNVYNGRVRRIPFIRGILALIETLILGIKSLLYSADIYMGEEEIKGKSAMIWVAMMIGVVMGIGLFIFIPLMLTRVIDPYIGSGIISNLIDGVIRLIMVVAYIWIIGFLPDIRRVFSYHGAEHKTINAFEDGVDLTVENVRKYGTAHTRCGTGFLLIVLTIATLVFMFTGRPSLYMRFLLRILLFPAIAAVSYELLRLSARYCKNRIVRILMIPGLSLQSLTTREPDDEQIEVGITSLSKVIDADAFDI